MKSDPGAPVYLPGLRKPGRQRKMIFRVATAVLRQFWFRPREAVGVRDIRENGDFIRDLAAAVRRGPTEPPRIYVDADQQLDLAATAWSHGLGERALEERIIRRRRQTARMAYLAFIAGWLILAWWFWQAWTARWTFGRLIAGLEFVPFCGLFFLLAFKNAWQNWQLRRRRLGSAMEYLTTGEPFWPS